MDPVEHMDQLVEELGLIQRRRRDRQLVEQEPWLQRTWGRLLVVERRIVAAAAEEVENPKDRHHREQVEVGHLEDQPEELQMDYQGHRRRSRYLLEQVSRILVE
jgi:hypothetical protein